MRNYIAFVLLVIGIWWPTAWLLAWFVGRTCNRCDLRARCEQHRPGAQILQHPGSKGFQ